VRIRVRVRARARARARARVRVRVRVRVIVPLGRRTWPAAPVAIAGPNSGRSRTPPAAGTRRADGPVLVRAAGRARAD